MNPTLATKAPAGLLFPLWASPKIDGVRAYVHGGVVLSRSGKPIPSDWVQRTYGHLEGHDGELLHGSFAETTRRVMSRWGCGARFVVFDRFDRRGAHDVRIAAADPRADKLVHIWVTDQTQLAALEASCLDAGYEGLMLRDPRAEYVQGRTRALMKLKRFADAEAEVVGFEESDRVGLLGAFIVRQAGTGEVFRVGAGLGEGQRIDFWRMRTQLEGKLLRYRYFPTNGMRAPRHAVFSGFRDPGTLDLRPRLSLISLHQPTGAHTMPRKGQFVSQDKAAALFRLYMAAAWENACNPCPVLQRIMQRYESLLSSLKVSAPKTA